MLAYLAKLWARCRGRRRCIAKGCSIEFAPADEVEVPFLGTVQLGKARMLITTPAGVKSYRLTTFGWRTLGSSNN